MDFDTSFTARQNRLYCFKQKHQLLKKRIFKSHASELGYDVIDDDLPYDRDGKPRS